MPTANLALPTIPENTLQPGVPVNSALETLDRAVAGLVTHEFTADANYTLLAAQYAASVLVFTDSPVTLTLGRDVIFPARFPRMLVINSTEQTLTLKKSGQAGVAIAAGARKTVVAGSTDVVEVGVATVNGESGAVTAVTKGKHAVPIVAGAMRQSVTGGCAPLATIASAADQPDIQTLDFDPATAEYAQFSIPMPKSWNEGTITAQFRWSHAATATNFGVVWAIQAVAVSSGDAIATAFGTAVLVTSTGGATNTLYMSAETAAVTIAGTPITADTVFFRVYRVAADAADTLAVDARLHGVVLFITTDADNDL